MKLRKKHKKVLNAIFTKPTLSNIVWEDIEKLFVALGAEIKQGNGSRVRVLLNEKPASFHEPHPQKEAVKGAVNSVRDFLTSAGINPEDYS